MRRLCLKTAGAVFLTLLVLMSWSGPALGGSGGTAQLTISKRTGGEIGWNVAGKGLALGEATVSSADEDRLRVKVSVDAGNDEELENKGTLQIRTKQWYDRPGKPYSAEDRCDYWEDTLLHTDSDGHGSKTFTLPALNAEDGEVYVQLHIRRRIGPPVWTRPAYSSKASRVALK